MDYDVRAEVLSQALPYIKKYSKKVVVVKYGGNAMLNDDLKRKVMNDLVLLNYVGIKTVLVHGGGPEITDAMHKMGKEPHFVNGLRYTDAETAEIVQMVLAGKVNKDLVALISEEGGQAVGISGIDGRLFKVVKQSGEDLGFVGEVSKVNTDIIEAILDKSFIPVIATVGLDDEGQVYNINADTAAAAVAAALGAENLIVMTDIRGLMTNPQDESTLIPLVKLSDVPRLMREGIVTGGMIPKLNCCVKAVRDGVKKAVMIDGRIPHSIIIEMLTDSGIGTMIQSVYTPDSNGRSPL